MLAKLLEEQGLSTDYEQRAGRKKIDVVAHVDGIKVALEAETGFHRKAPGHQRSRCHATGAGSGFSLDALPSTQLRLRKGIMLLPELHARVADTAGRAR